MHELKYKIKPVNYSQNPHTTSLLSFRITLHIHFNYKTKIFLITSNFFYLIIYHYFNTFISTTY